MHDTGSPRNLSSEMALNEQQYAKVKDVFSQAIAAPESQWSAIVAAQAEQDPVVADEVRSLLRHHRDVTLLDSPPQESTEPTAIMPGGAVRQAIDFVDPEVPVDTFLVQREIWEENRQILRRRLIVIAMVMSLFIAVSMIRLMTYHYAAVGYGVRVAALLISLGAAWVLHSDHKLSLRRLRIIELVVMVNAGLLASVIYLRMLLDAAIRQDVVMFVSINNWHFFAWALLILIYGIFMPNNWQRAAAVVFPMVLVPNLTIRLAAWIDPQIPLLLAQDTFGKPIPEVFVAACIATYTAHLIHGARLSAFQARRLAQYKIKRLIGEGGMGRVYEAEHLLLKRSCAIKLIQPERSVEGEALQRFEREVRATAKLTHPHTIEVYDYGQTNEGVFFFAMELLPGMNLREMVKRTGPMPAPRAIHFLIEICEALQEAHKAGLIHRDIKPANVFASQRGGIDDYTKLLDFGVVRDATLDLDPHTAAVEAQRITGTPDYMSPEQVATPSLVGPPSDLYSIGAVGYYLLTGRPPLTGGSLQEVMRAKLTQTPEPPSTHAADVPADLEAILMRCLSTNPGGRPGSAAELLNELRSCESAGRWSEEDASAWWTAQTD
ncbi:serine/threonine-protein kinase [Rosistilla oblonga]|uniref:serine/threonine-protein kinase n=1 Tax=Rosistilla oblonga TaxID=2527990 RepID=UPI003A981480